ncbi:MAG: HD domain-containing protein [Saccharofermentans sp.]|nr:HD domain-containing protein [Saccharofermentans sp.]
MEYLYLACLLVSLGMLFWLKIFDVRNSVTQFVSLLIIVASNLGFYLECTSTVLEELLLAQKLAYLGGIFLPVFYFILVLEICHIGIKKSISTILIMIQCVLFGFVCTIGHNGLFYKSAGIKFVNGNAILIREYGPVHTIQLISLFAYLVAVVTVLTYALVKKKTINRRGVIAMVVLGACSIVAYVLEKILGFEYEIIPVVYDLLMLGALIPVYKSNLYTVYEKEDIINEQLGKLGYLTFDKKRIYQDSNAYMEDIFPELSRYRVGQRLEKCSEELKKLVDLIDLHDELNHKSSNHEHGHTDIAPFWLGDKCYEGKIHAVTNTFGHVKGYTIELRDDTADQMVIKLKENYAEELSKEVHIKTKRIRHIQQKTIMGMAQMVESRDLSTGGHIKRTSDVVRIFAKKLRKENFGLDSHFLHLVIRSAPMHDIGKIGVDDAVLRKQGRFTDEEYAKMKQHSEIGYHMVSEILAEVEEPDFVAIAENVAHYHHEKVDGTGYPHGLKGDEIPVEARIMALADVFDALVSKRCYKDAFSYDKAFEIIENDAGTHFDAGLAKVFISCRPELEEYYNKSEA